MVYKVGILSIQIGLLVLTTHFLYWFAPPAPPPPQTGRRREFMTYLDIFLGTWVEVSTFSLFQISLAAWGRKEIELAENEMPGKLSNSSDRALFAILISSFTFRFDVLAKEAWCRSASQGRSYCRLSPHDYSDRCPHVSHRWFLSQSHLMLYSITHNLSLSQ